MSQWMCEILIFISNVSKSVRVYIQSFSLFRIETYFEWDFQVYNNYFLCTQNMV